MITFHAASVAEYAAPATPEVWRRYLAMLIDGLRPHETGYRAPRARPHRNAARRA